MVTALVVGCSAALTPPVLAVPTGTGQSEPRSAPTAVEPTTQAGSWTAQQVISTLTTAPMVKLDGSPAVFDQARIVAAIGSSPVRILALPFAPKAADPHAQDVEEVRTWAVDHDITLVVVTGLQAEVGGLLLRPDSLPTLQRVMLRSDLTEQMLYVVAHPDLGHDNSPDEPAVVEREVPAGAGEIDTISAALAREKYFAGPGSGAPARPFDDWQSAGTDRVVRVALMAPPAAGAPFVDLLTPLAARFPHDIVVVATGRWVEMAGPEQSLLSSAVLYGYGTYYQNVTENGVATANLVLAMSRRVGDLRSGEVSGRAGPATSDPVSSVSPALPWLFAGTALLVVVGALLIGRLRTSRRRRLARSAGNRGARLSAQLAILAAQIVQLDGLAGQGRSAELLTRASERYGTARDVLSRRGDELIAETAIEQAAKELQQAAGELGVRLADPGETSIDAAQRTGQG